MATEAEINAAKAQVLADAEAGISSTTVDGERVDLMPLDKRLDAIERVATSEATTKSFFGGFTKRLKSPGAWS